MLIMITKDVPVKISEQKEIKATDLLKIEIEQKQLLAPPERLDTQSPQKAFIKKKAKAK